MASSPPSPDRSQMPHWMRPVTERLSPLVRAFVIAETFSFLIYLFAAPARVLMADHLAIGPGFLHGEPWQPLTALFVHLNAPAFVMNLIGLWFLGATIEGELGRGGFLVLFFVPAVVGYAAEGAATHALGRIEVNAGCGNAIMALLVALGVRYDRAHVRVLGTMTMEARHLAMLLLGLSLAVELMDKSWPSAAGTAVAAAVAFALSNGRWLQRLGVHFTPAAGRQRRRYQVLEGGRSSKGRGMIN